MGAIFFVGHDGNGFTRRIVGDPEFKIPSTGTYGIKDSADADLWTLDEATGDVTVVKGDLDLTAGSLAVVNTIIAEVGDALVLGTGNDKAPQVPQITTAQKGGLATALGMIVYDTDTAQFEGYDGAWSALGGGLPTGLTLTGTDNYLLNQGTPAQILGIDQTQDNHVHNDNGGPNVAMIGRVATKGGNLGGNDLITRRFTSPAVAGFLFGGIGDPTADVAINSQNDVVAGNGAGRNLAISWAVQSGDTRATVRVSRGAPALLVGGGQDFAPINEEVGGGIVFTTGPGGDSAGGVAGVGGEVIFTAGVGGAADGTNVGGVGGQVLLRGGVGGVGSGTEVGGLGGTLNLEAGAGGVTGGFGAGANGAINLGVNNTTSVDIGNSGSVTDIIGSIGVNLIRSQWAFGG